jgi:hypothetical protein
MIIVIDGSGVVWEGRKNLVNFGLLRTLIPLLANQTTYRRFTAVRIRLALSDISGIVQILGTVETLLLVPAKLNGGRIPVTCQIYQISNMA